jgi:hypothetical protein
MLHTTVAVEDSLDLLQILGDVLIGLQELGLECGAMDKPKSDPAASRTR